MEHTTIDQLRTWHRSNDYERVLEVLESSGTQLGAEARLLLGLSQFMSGHSETGLKTIQPALETSPTNRYWQSDVALARLITGDVASAKRLLEECLQAEPPEAVDFGRMAAVSLAQQDNEAAARYYAEAVDREPGREHWHHNLGGVLLRSQKYEEALEQYDRALAINPEFQQSVNGRRQLLASLDRTEELVEELEAQLAKEPDSIAFRLQLARAYQQDQRLSDALRCLNEAITPLADLLTLKQEDSAAFEEVKKEQISLRAVQGEFLSARSRHALALKKWDEVEQLEPEDRLAIGCSRGNALVELQRFDEAEELFEELLTDYPDNNQLKICRSHLLCERGDYAASESLLRELLEVYPGNASLLTNLGQTLMWIGKLEEAAQCFEKASEINPMALAQLVKTRTLPSDPGAIEKMEKIAENRLLAKEPRANMSYALADLHDKNKNYSAAAHFLQIANELTDKGLNYAAEGFTRRVDANIRVFSQQYFEQLEPIRHGNRTPVFVVGMPRSGTTLTEQILCSHPSVFGAGELDLLPVLTRLMPRVLKVKRVFPGCMLRMTRELREEAARYYLYGIMQHDEELPFVVDKMPHNFMNLGLIAAILPGARIIHVNRDPRDNALSNFQQNFKAKDGGMGFAFNLDNLARQINDYQRMMQHWREVLPMAIFELSYEELVEDQEGITRELLDFIGVDWDDSVTDFHKTERAVRTASVSQVRQPIYRTSKQKWRNYEELLQPLIEQLDPELLAQWS